MLKYQIIKYRDNIEIDSCGVYDDLFDAESMVYQFEEECEENESYSIMELDYDYNTGEILSSKII